jgi:hypothetical protein
LAVEVEIGFNALAFIPGSFIDTDPFARMAGKAIVTQVIGRVGEYHIHAGFRQAGQHRKNIAMVKVQGFIRMQAGGGGHRVGVAFTRVGKEVFALSILEGDRIL